MNINWEKLQNEFESIQQEIVQLRSEINPDDKLFQHFIERLSIASANAKGCAILAREDLVVPMIPIARSVLESLIATYWASLKKENADIILEASLKEMLRVMRNNLREGRAKIIDSNTEEVKTDFILNSPEIAGAKRPPRYDNMAQEAGIKDIYDSLYGFLSLLSHGTATDILVQMCNDGKSTFRILEAARSCTESIRLVVVNHIRGRKTSREELDAILNARLT